MRKRRAYECVELFTWQTMKQRCLNPNCSAYKNYGARGIKICDRWLNSYENFLADMGRRPAGRYSLDRIDTNGDYSPENCRWATDEEQASNTRRSVHLEWNGRRLTQEQWSRETGLSRMAIYARLKKGWPAERVLGTPSNRVRRQAPEANP